MTDFTLDTSGVVQMTPKAFQREGVFYCWPDLSPFEQGYVEVMFADSYDALFDEWWERHDSFNREKGLKLRFSDLSPEALARIRKDCAALAELFSGTLTAEDGRRFWIARQAGFPDLSRHTTQAAFVSMFPPLTPYLSDDGKVNLKES